jgi:hypothetical protein
MLRRKLRIVNPGDPCVGNELLAILSDRLLIANTGISVVDGVCFNVRSTRSASSFHSGPHDADLPLSVSTRKGTGTFVNGPNSVLPVQLANQAWNLK